MKLVALESPYAGDIEKNIEYARACAADCFKRGEAPFISHILYTQPGILRDEIPEERKLGMQAGFLWSNLAEKTVVYTDHGISEGMEAGIDRAKKEGQLVEYRSLYEKPIWFHFSIFGNSEDYSVYGWEAAKREVIDLIKYNVGYCCEMKPAVEKLIEEDKWQEAVELFNKTNAVKAEILMQEGKRVYGI